LYLAENDFPIVIVFVASPKWNSALLTVGDGGIARFVTEPGREKASAKRLTGTSTYS
jgi:hypothetical protein